MHRDDLGLLEHEITQIKARSERQQSLRRKINAIIRKMSSNPDDAKLIETLHELRGEEQALQEQNRDHSKKISERFALRPRQ